MSILSAVLGDAATGGVGSLLSTVKGMIGQFKLDPEKKAEFQAAIDANSAILLQKQVDLEVRIQDSIDKETQSAADIIKLEAQSSSWLPKNVRPLLLLIWGLTISIPPIVSVATQFTAHPMQPITLDPWIYKLTVIGFTGYVVARSYDKKQQTDSNK